MWSASPGNKTTTTNTITSPTSRSTSNNTCLCPKTKTHLTRKSMEEIWEGINLSSLNHRSPAVATAFPPAADQANNSPGYDGVGRVMGRSDRVRSDPQPQNQANSCGGPDPDGPDPSFLSTFNSPFEALSPSPDPFPSFSKKRASKNDDGSGNCRHKRMIKNRESAARSRARKQAYANGLETEVTRLLEENARLRRQVERYRAAAAAQLPKKQTLTRTLTAPF